MTQPWRQEVCLWQGANPPKKVYHDFTVYWCSGITYFSCNGYGWVYTNINCGPLSITTLPECHEFSVPGDWVYCE